MFKKLGLFFVCCMLFASPTMADMSSAKEKLAEIKINDNTVPEIKKIYEELSSLVSEYDNLSENYKSELQDNADAMKAKEQSTENKLLGAASMGAAGIGGMQLLSGMAEKNADDDAERDMAAYLQTFKCDYGGGMNITGGQTGIELPGGNVLTQLVTEYKALAADLKIRKESLGLAPGIESEEIMDKATMGLYDDVSIGKTDGTYTSVARAITDKNSTDATEFNEQKGDAQKKIKTGAVLAGTGAVGGALGNLIINKDAPKERSAEITNKYNSQKEKINTQIDDTETKLNAAITQNSEQIKKYNDLLHKYNDKTNQECDGKAPCYTECAGAFNEFKQYLDSLTEIQDNTQFVDVAATETQLSTKDNAWHDCIKNEHAKEQEKLAIEKQKQECETQSNKEWDGEKCVDKQVIARGKANPTKQNTDDTVKTEDKKDDSVVAATTKTDPDQCPDENLRFSNAKGKRVGDFCSYGNVAKGKIIKFTSDNKNKTPHQIKGQCTCSALECKPGYGDINNKPISGACNETVKDAKGMCLKKEYDATTHKIDIKSAGAPECSKFCAERAKENKCTDTKKHMTVQSKNLCVCNYDANDANALSAIQESNRKYYAVCGDDKDKSGGTEYCLDKTFGSNALKLNTNTAQGAVFARMLIKGKYKTDATCDITDTRKYDNEYYMKCTSTDNTTFFEVRFDDLTESNDEDREESQRKTFCKLVGREVITATTTASYGYNTPTACKVSNAAECDTLKSWASELAYNLTYETRRIQRDFMGFQENVTGCWIDSRTSEYYKNGNAPADNLAKIDGLDNFKFYGIDSLNKSVPNAIRDYVHSVKGQSARVDCNSNPTTVPNLKGNIHPDEIYRCTVDGQPIDFAFDDTSELFWYKRAAGESGLGCAALGGTYTGEGCINVGKQECEKLIKRLQKTCPSCDKPEWQESENRCYLPDSDFADNIDFAGKIAGMVTVTVGGVVMTIMTGGAGVGAAILAITEAVGGVIEITAEVSITRAAGEFLDQTAKCSVDNCGTCAENVLRDLHTHIAQATDYSAIEVNAIDSEISRLFECLPENSPLTTELAEKIDNGIVNSNEGVTGEWSEDQIWRTVGGVLGLASFVSGLIKSATKAGTKLTKSTGAIKRKLTAVDKNVARVKKATAKTTPGTAANAKKTAQLEKNLHQQEIVDRAAAGTLTDADRAEIAADGNKTLRQSVNHVTTDTKTAKEIASDGATLKEYDQLIAKQNRTATENQRLNQIRNSWGNPSDDVIAAARVESKNMADAAEIERTREQVAKYDEWAEKNPGQAKQNPTRQAEMDALRKRVADADAASGGNNTNAVTDVTALRNRASDAFDIYVQDVKRTGQSVSFPGDRMTNAEWARLNDSLSDEGVRLVDGPGGTKLLEKATDTSRVTNSSTRSKIDGLDAYVAQLKNSSGDTVVLGQKANLSDAELKLMNDDLASQGMKLSNSGQGDLILQRIDNGTVRSEPEFVPPADTPKPGNMNKKIKLDQDIAFVDGKPVQGQELADMRTKADAVLGNSGNPDAVSAAKNSVNNMSDVKRIVNPSDFKYSDGGTKLYVRNSISDILGESASSNPTKAMEQIDDMYDKIRRGVSYSVNNRNIDDAISAMEYPAYSNIRYSAPSKNYSWHVHSATNASRNVNYHISLNVDVNAELIKKLDNLMATDDGRHIADFKIPPVGSRWQTMADPISIYLSNTSPQIERQIAEIASQYVRTSDAGLLGRKISDGVAIAFETSGNRTDIVENIIQQVATKDNQIAQAIRSRGRFSVGNTEALRIWASDFLGYEIAPVIP